MTHPRLLLIDDEPALAEFLASAARGCGFEPRITDKDEDFRDQFIADRPEMVALDLGMPGMDGLETASRIQQLAAGKGLSLIAVTGWGQHEDRQRTEAAGFVAHFVKPIKIDQLEALLARITASDSAPAKKTEQRSSA